MTKITLYTNHNCPWAHRVHIALAELGLEFEEVIIDLGKPREPWYLEINPRGLVPALKYGDHLIIESGVITQFLADLKPSSLLPSSGSVDGAFARSRVNLFNDTFVSKFITPFISSVLEKDEEIKATKTNQFVGAIEKDITPLLKDAGPFFGGSKELTLAEVNTASFVIRLYAYIKPEAGLVPASVGDRLRANKTWQAWVDAVLAKESVTKIYNEEDNIQRTKTRIARKN